MASPPPHKPILFLDFMEFWGGGLGKIIVWKTPTGNPGSATAEDSQIEE